MNLTKPVFQLSIVGCPENNQAWLLTDSFFESFDIQNRIVRCFRAGLESRLGNIKNC